MAERKEDDDGRSMAQGHDAVTHYDALSMEQLYTCAHTHERQSYGEVRHMRHVRHAIPPYGGGLGS